MFVVAVKVRMITSEGNWSAHSSFNGRESSAKKLQQGELEFPPLYNDWLFLIAKREIKTYLWSLHFATDASLLVSRSLPQSRVGINSTVWEMASEKVLLLVFISKLIWQIRKHQQQPCQRSTGCESVERIRHRRGHFCCSDFSTAISFVKVLLSIIIAGKKPQASKQSEKTSWQCTLNSSCSIGFLLPRTCIQMQSDSLWGVSSSLF